MLIYKFVQRSEPTSILLELWNIHGTIKTKPKRTHVERIYSIPSPNVISHKIISHNVMFHFGSKNSHNVILVHNKITLWKFFETENIISISIS